MGTYKEIDIEEKENFKIRTFKGQDLLPKELQQYLADEGFHFRKGKYSFVEKQPVRTDSLFFLGDHKYTSNSLTYTITDLEEPSKKLVIGTDVDYSFFELLASSMVDEGLY